MRKFFLSAAKYGLVILLAHLAVGGVCEVFSISFLGLDRLAASPVGTFFYVVFSMCGFMQGNGLIGPCSFPTVVFVGTLGTVLVYFLAGAIVYGIKIRLVRPRV